jgi:hypothetical protein
MYSTFEGVVYPQGNTRIFAFVRYNEPRRALITILDEPPHIDSHITSPISAERMREPLTFGTRVIDLAELNEVVDEGDYVFLNFGLFHQPPYLYLFGDDAEAVRRWLKEQDIEPEEHVKNALTPEQIERIEAQVTAGEMLSDDVLLHVLAELRRIRQDRDSVLRYSARVVQSLMDNTEAHLKVLMSNQVRSVSCTLGEGCKVRTDGSCSHTDDLETGALTSETLPF